MVIEIRIEPGTSGVTVSIKGHGGSHAASLGAVTKTVTLGDPVPADGGAPTTPIGPGGSGGGSGVVVVGPIVIGGSIPAAAGDGKGGAPTTPIGPGGDGASGSGVVVVGPIVIGGSGVANTATTEEITSE